MELWTGFLIGLLGGFHCIGMCGPIVIALPSGKNGRFAFLAGRLLYNFGRLLTYSILGFASGVVGGAIAFAGYQGTLSITMGILILLYLVIPGGFRQRIFSFSFFGSVGATLKSYWGKLFGSGSKSSLLLIGILNGFLPCGLVYVALAGAISTKSAISGMLYMSLFGLGTAPSLLILSFAGNIIGSKFKDSIRRLIPIGAVVLAGLFILRGLSLGIPYVSPKIVKESKSKTTMECCSPSEETADSLSIESH